MAETKEKKPIVKQENIEKKEIIVKEEPRNRQLWIIWAVIGGMLLLLGMVALSAYIVRNYFPDHKVQPGTTQIQADDRWTRWTGFRGGFRNVEYTTSSSQSDGLNTTTTTRTYVSTMGVVTKVSNSSVTIAGAGKSQDITLNDETVFVGNKKPSVNDSVIITSDKDGDKLTATNVRVLN